MAQQRDLLLSCAPPAHSNGSSGLGRPDFDDGQWRIVSIKPVS